MVLSPRAGTASQDFTRRAVRTLRDFAAHLGRGPRASQTAWPGEGRWTRGNSQCRHSRFFKTFQIPHPARTAVRGNGREHRRSVFNNRCLGELCQRFLAWREPAWQVHPRLQEQPAGSRGRRAQRQIGALHDQRQPALLPDSKPEVFRGSPSWCVSAATHDRSRRRFRR
jgi:hypothetical protein